LQLAEWPDEQEVWTGSCPCSPFSWSGKERGAADDRHLWPVWFDLIRQCRPATIFGEQVMQAVRHAWFDAVATDLESIGYAIGAAIIPAAGVGAPHLRDRLWFVAHTNDTQLDGRGLGARPTRLEPADRGKGGQDGNAIPHPDRGRCEIERLTQHSAQQGACWAQSDGFCSTRSWDRPQSITLRDANSSRLAHREGISSDARKEKPAPAIGANWWQSEPDVGRVAHGLPGRVAHLSGLGNAIVPQVAAAFIASFMETQAELHSH